MSGASTSDNGFATAGSSRVSPVGFSLTLPPDWFELDVRPRTRDGRIRSLVEERIHDQPQLWEHRNDLARLLRQQARNAWDAGALYCSCFVIVLEESVIAGALTVSIIPPPPGGISLDAISEQLPSHEANNDGDTWMTRSLVTIEGAGRAVRSQGVIDVELPSSGWIRTIVMRTFVPIDAERLLMVSGTSTAVDLAEPLLDLLGAVTSTLVVVDDATREA